MFPIIGKDVLFAMIANAMSFAMATARAGARAEASAGALPPQGGFI